MVVVEGGKGGVKTKTWLGGIFVHTDSFMMMVDTSFPPVSFPQKDTVRGGKKG